MIGMILSRTTMGDGMCTVIALNTHDQALEQIRLLNQQGGPPSIRGFGYPPETIASRWTFGREIEVPSIKRENPRPTHPEDRRVNLRSIRLLDTVHTWEVASRVLGSFIFNSVIELFPDIQPGQSYILERPLPRSVGYVRNAVVELYGSGDDIRATITDARGRRLEHLPVKGIALCRRARAELAGTRIARLIYHNAVVRLSIASPWQHGNGRRKCYIQVSDVHGI